MKCITIKPNKTRCGANAMKDSRFCFTHNPQTKDAKSIAVQKGGQAVRKSPDPLPVIEIRDAKSIATLLISTINEVRAGTTEIRIANCVGYLAGHLIKAFELTTVEDRLVEIERVILERKKYR